MNDTKIGTVTHYYDKIAVAVIDLSDDLKVGDKIRFSRGGEDLFEQEVTSIQFDHSPVEAAGSGQSVGIQTISEVKNGAEVFKLE